ncbi:DUF1642 domain-containing protein [Streptococcus cristatus]|uniref:DUF1642 domain-containing protein n=1 Tax=Streptococcus cristatus TaxID=45634 RepID=UPI0028F01F75|nr:DUF1642 domain-containing protein [Streptococcus cristatus]
MKKEEVINKINEMTVETFFSKTLFVQQKKVIELIEQLDEPEKVKIPQFVAEIIEYYKGQNATLYDALREKNFNKQYSEWLLNEQNAYDKVARAWLDGYEVEKEKRYLVKVVGMNRINGCLSYNKNLDKWFFGAVTDQKPYRTKHTRKELEQAGFGWVFDCPGIEIEEVE